MYNNTRMTYTAPTMIQAYDTFIKQTNGKPLLVNDIVCRGINCDRIECRNACGMIRMHKMNAKKKRSNK